MMKHLIPFLLLFTLASNAFAAVGVCLMEHHSVSVKAEVMPCHDLAQHEVTPTEFDDTQSDEHNSHLCDCDKCAQYVQPFFALTASTPLADAHLSNSVNHKFLEISPNYRPPIQYSV